MLLINADSKVCCCLFLFFSFLFLFFFFVCLLLFFVVVVLFDCFFFFLFVCFFFVFFCLLLATCCMIIIKKGKVVIMTNPELRLWCVDQLIWILKKKLKLRLLFMSQAPELQARSEKGARGCIRTALTCPNISESQFVTRN